MRAAARLGHSNLLKAGWIERPIRANYRITDGGRDWYANHPNGITDFSTARMLIAPFWPQLDARKPILSVVDETLVEDIDRIEQIESGISRIHSNVGDALLTRLRESHPNFFEQAVVDLLLNMGYGGAEQRGKRIGGSNDGGVDGVIDQDALGLDRIYTQAKRYADGNTVGREQFRRSSGHCTTSAPRAASSSPPALSRPVHGIT